MPGKEMEMRGEEERDRENRYVPETFLDSATPHPFPFRLLVGNKGRLSPLGYAGDLRENPFRPGLKNVWANLFTSVTRRKGIRLNLCVLIP